MTKTIEELKQRAQEVAELDKERIKGNYYVHYNGYFLVVTTTPPTEESKSLRHVLGDTEIINGELIPNPIEEDGTIEFLAHAPAMAKLIADQHAKIEELLERLCDVEDMKHDLAFKYNDLLLRTLMMESEKDNDATL